MGTSESLSMSPWSTAASSLERAWSRFMSVSVSIRWPGRHVSDSLNLSTVVGCGSSSSCGGAGAGGGGGGGACCCCCCCCCDGTGGGRGRAMTTVGHRRYWLFSLDVFAIAFPVLSCSVGIYTELPGTREGCEASADQCDKFCRNRFRHPVTELLLDARRRRILGIDAMAFLGILGACWSPCGDGATVAFLYCGRGIVCYDLINGWLSLLVTRSHENFISGQDRVAC